MKSFVKYLLLFVLCYFVLVVALRLFWISSASLTIPKNRIGRDVHSLVLGASNGEFSWNDRIIDGTLNLSEGSLSYGACLSKLKWAIQNNTSKIDTLVLCASFTSFVYIMDDDLEFQLWDCREERRNIFNYNTFLKHYLPYPWFWKYFLSCFPLVNFNAMIQVSGGFKELDRDYIQFPEIYDRINGVIDKIGTTPSAQNLRFRCGYQLDNLCQIRNYCNEHNVVLVIFSPPVWRIPSLIDDTGYRRLICDELGDSTLIADYSRFNLPDSTYFSDLEHLKSKGADFFSTNIATEGLKTQYAIDWCQNCE